MRIWGLNTVMYCKYNVIIIIVYVRSYMRYMSPLVFYRYMYRYLVL